MAGDATGQISNWAGGGASVTLGAAQLAYGLYKQKHNKRPVYEIPDEVNQNLTDAQRQALQGLPEEQKQQFISNIQRGQAYGLGQLGSRKAGLAGVAALNQQSNDAYGNLLAMDSQARMQNQAALMQQRQNVADYKDQAFQFNKVNPYYEQTASNNAMIGAGMQNVSQGFQAGNTGGDFTKNSQPQQAQLQQRMAGSGYAQGVQMDSNQLGGYNQQTTPNPYQNQQELNVSGYQGGSFWGQ
jgi:hypothetical protein